MLSKKKGGVEITVDDTTFWVQPSISGSDIQDGLKLLRSLNRIHEAVKVATSSIPSLEKMNQLDIVIAEDDKWYGELLQYQILLNPDSP